ncbi:MAG: ribonuclease III [Kineosporiaceae bacterium]
MPDAVAGARAALLDALGVVLPPDLLERALVHRSWSYENGGVPTNERLEFLGDAVLGLVVADALFRRHPDVDEDQLSRMRIAVVSRAALASVGRALGVGEAVRLGRGEEGQGGRDKDSILEDTTEALVGAVYLAHGIDTAREVVLRIADPLLRTAGTAVDADRKTALQVLAAQRGLPPPRYQTDGDGPVHERTFTSRVRLGDEVAGTGVGRTKKAAEHAAAAAAVAALAAPGGDGAGAP